jgi:hypothetical protein
VVIAIIAILAGMLCQPFPAPKPRLAGERNGTTFVNSDGAGDTPMTPTINSLRPSLTDKTAITPYISYFLFNGPAEDQPIKRIP